MIAQEKPQPIRHFTLAVRIDVIVPKLVKRDE